MKGERKREGEKEKREVEVALLTVGCGPPHRRVWPSSLSGVAHIHFNYDIIIELLH